MRYIVQALVKTLLGDSGKYPTTKVTYKGKDTDAVRQSVYGLCSQPPIGSNGILFSVDCTNSTKYGIFDFMTGRFKNLESGEVQLGNYLTQASLKFDKDGNVTLNVPSGNFTANISGDATVNATDVDVNCASLTAVVSGNTNITTNAFNVTSTGGTSSITGNLNLNGSMTVTGDVTANDFNSYGISVSFNSHVHTGDSGGTTGTPR